MSNYIKLIVVIFFSFFLSPVKFYRQYVLKQDLANFSDKEILKYVSDLPGYIIEAGAWDGKDTARLLDLFPKSKVICFEPMPEMFAYLSTNFLDQRQRVKIINRALTSSPLNELKFTYSSNLNPSGSLNTPVLHKNFPGKTNFNKEVMVKTYNLNRIFIDEPIDVVNLLWLDVQGSELEIIKTLEEVHLKKIRFIHLEVSKVQLYRNQPKERDIVAYLKSKGFIVVARTVPILSGNVLFMNSALLK